MDLAAESLVIVTSVGESLSETSSSVYPMSTTYIHPPHTQSPTCNPPDFTVPRARVCNMWTCEAKTGIGEQDRAQRRRVAAGLGTRDLAAAGGQRLNLLRVCLAGWLARRLSGLPHGRLELFFFFGSVGGRLMSGMPRAAERPSFGWRVWFWSGIFEGWVVPRSFTFTGKILEVELRVLR